MFSVKKTLNPSLNDVEHFKLSAHWKKLNLLFLKLVKCAFVESKINASKTYLNCAKLCQNWVSTEAEVCERIVIEARDAKISRQEVLNFHMSGSIRRKKALETGKCFVV